MAGVIKCHPFGEEIKLEANGDFEGFPVPDLLYIVWVGNIMTLIGCMLFAIIFYFVSLLKLEIFIATP